MTAEESSVKLGEERRLMFQNLVNGVPMESITAAFKRSSDEVWREVDFVGRKIREYRFRRNLPPLECQGINALRRNRQALLETLSHLGPSYLSSELLLPKINVQTVDAYALREIKRRMK